MLDFTGPLEVFTFANRILQEGGITRENVYPVTILAEQPGPVTTMSGMKIIAEQSYRQIDENFDTLLIPGSDVNTVLADTNLAECIKVIAPKVRRLVSVCTGAFLLAENGLLDGRRATTHWNWCRELG